MIEFNSASEGDAQVIVSVHMEFMRSLGRLAAQDRKATEDMLLRIQSGGITPGMRRHQIVADGETFTSLSPTMDIRVLAVEQDAGVTMLYVDHHDKAYQWAERNKARLSVALPLLATGGRHLPSSSPVKEAPKTTTSFISEWLDRKQHP